MNRFTALSLLPVAAAGFSVLLASCKVGPDYTRMDPETGEEWISAGADSASPKDIARWWKRFRDPKLNELIERALEANQDLRIARARVAEAAAARRAARSDLFPQLNLGGGATRSRSSENASRTGDFPGISRNLTTNFFDLNLDASWEVDVFGGSRRALEAARADEEAAREYAREIRIGVAAEVATAYLELRGYQYRQSVARRNLKSQQETLELTRTRQAGGVASDLDVSRAEAQMESTSATLPVFETGIRSSIFRLGVLLGGTPDSLVNELIQAKAPPVAPPSVPVGLRSDLLRRRPDVRRSERELAAATARLGVAIADLYPKFTLTGSAGVQSLEADTLFEGRSGVWSLGPSLRWPVFTAGRIRAGIAAQNARQEQAAAAYEKAVYGAIADAETSLVRFGQEQKRLASLTRSVDATRRAARLASERYKAGLENFLAVLEADRQLLAAEDAQAESQTQVNLNLVLLYKALGGGWNDLPQKKGPAKKEEAPAKGRRKRN